MSDTESTESTETAPPPTDDEASRAYEAELAEVTTDTAVVPVEYEGIDTRTPEANYATRSNIVEP